MHRVARLSRGALERNVAAYLRLTGDDAAVDVRADAYGHGADQVIAHAAAAGVRRFTSSPDAVLPAGLSHAPADERSLAVYGFTPGSTPVLSLEGEVISVKSVPAGSAVSYGYSYRTASPGRLALIGLGYADGIPRRASNRARAALAGAFHPLAGRVAMDQLVLDLRETDARPGDLATLWGDPAAGAVSLLEWSERSGRSPAALTAALGTRIRREWSA